MRALQRLGTKAEANMLAAEELTAIEEWLTTHAKFFQVKFRLANGYVILCREPDGKAHFYYVEEIAGAELKMQVTSCKSRILLATMARLKKSILPWTRSVVEGNEKVPAFFTVQDSQPADPVSLEA
jgi:hypothetical protein